MRSRPTLALVNVGGVPTAYYSEGLQIGYRWYDEQSITPRYPFGSGLSVSSNGSQPVTVTGRVRNARSRTGAKVVQVFLGMPAALQEPPKRLVGFQKVWLNPGEETTVEITIDPNATSHPLSYWDATAYHWAILPGTYTLSVGTSSRDTIAMTSHRIKGAE